MNSEVKLQIAAQFACACLTNQEINKRFDNMDEIVEHALQFTDVLYKRFQEQEAKRINKQIEAITEIP